MGNRIIVLTHLTLVILLSSCVSDEPRDTDNNIELTIGGNGVYVGNEGNFQFANASLSYVNDSVLHSGNLFSNTNEIPLGDVLQSLAKDESRLFLVVNNSGKVEVVDKLSLESKGTITGLTSPRFLQKVSNSKAYVSDLYGNGISIVNLNEFSVEGLIPVPGWTEEMLYYIGRVYVCAPQLNKVYTIDAIENTLVDSVEVPDFPNSMVQDKYGNIWVLCGGDYALEASETYLVRINPLTNSVDFTMSVGSGYAFDLSVNRDNDSLVFVQDNRIKIAAINDAGLGIPGTIYENDEINIYAMDLNPRDNMIWFSDAKDFIQQSEIKVMTTKGQITSSVDVGINSGSFLFQ